MSDENQNEKQDDNLKAGASGVIGRRYKRPSRRLEDVSRSDRSSNVWLISFTDVMALMLTFFVLLFSMTEPTKQDWTNMKSALQAEFNKFYGAIQNRGPQDTLNINKINFNRALAIGYLDALIETVIVDNEYLKDAVLITQQGQLIISLPQDLLFEPGQTEVSERGTRALYALGGTLSRIKNRIEITGHADPRPVNAAELSRYGSNWELSIARAANVAGALQIVGYDREIVIHGYASGRYQDLSSIQNEDQRLALARRVDIVLLDHDGTRQKLLFDTQAE